jgi:hypothetical protein
MLTAYSSDQPRSGSLLDLNRYMQVRLTSFINFPGMYDTNPALMSSYPVLLLIAS